jgi:hypothetical protein
MFVEGYTERAAVPAFLKRWLDPRLPQPVGIKPVRFDGWAELVADVRFSCREGSRMGRGIGGRRRKLRRRSR